MSIFWTLSGSCPLCLTPPCYHLEPPATMSAASFRLALDSLRVSRDAVVSALLTNFVRCCGNLRHEIRKLEVLNGVLGLFFDVKFPRRVRGKGRSAAKCTGASVGGTSCEAYMSDKRAMEVGAVSF